MRACQKMLSVVGKLKLNNGSTVYSEYKLFFVCFFWIFVFLIFLVFLFFCFFCFFWFLFFLFFLFFLIFFEIFFIIPNDKYTCEGQKFILCFIIYSLLTKSTIKLKLFDVAISVNFWCHNPSLIESPSVCITIEY